MTSNTSNIMKNLYVVGIIILSLYMFGMTVYSGYTADNNKPDDDSNGLFIASYVICILECIIYLCGFFFVIFSGVSDSKSNSNSNGGGGCIQLLLDIYWIVIYFNYDVSEKYDEYALVKTIEFFTLLGILVLGICTLCIGNCIYSDEKLTTPRINERNSSILTTV